MVKCSFSNKYHNVKTKSHNDDVFKFKYYRETKTFISMRKYLLDVGYGIKIKRKRNVLEILYIK